MKRFWNKVDRSAGDDGCWPWLAHKDRAGYGRFMADNNYLTGAHRVSAFLAGMLNTLRPKDGNRGNELVLHKCDNPACVNPRHLFVGSHRDNMLDMVSKERQAWGERGGGAKLSNDEVETIHAARQLGVRAKTIAAHLEVHVGHIQNIGLGYNRKLRAGSVIQLLLDELVAAETCITPSDRLEARTLFAAGNITRRELAERYGVSLPSMSTWLKGIKGLRQKYPARNARTTRAANIEDARAYWGMGLCNSPVELYELFKWKVSWADILAITR